jgi:predicted DNA-binding transcriptional regulator AlpA
MTGDGMDPLDTLLTGREAAELLRLSARTMERHRTTGTGPKFVRLGRAIRYRRRDLLDHLDRHAHRSTSEPDAASAAG